MPLCKHFKHDDDGVRVCLIGNHEGNPSIVDCMECQDYDGPTRGFGDSVARFIEHAKKAPIFRGKDNTAPTSKGCSGCAKRRAKLNKIFPKRTD